MFQAAIAALLAFTSYTVPGRSAVRCSRGCADVFNVASVLGTAAAIVPERLVQKHEAPVEKSPGDGSAAFTVAPAWTGAAGRGCGAGPGLWAGDRGPDCELDLAVGHHTVRHQRRRL